MLQLILRFLAGNFSHCRHFCFSRVAAFIVIIYLLKSTEQEDAHMIKTRTRAGQERHRKLALTFCP